jgi:O-antigen/teichoic acid export membrane protein
MINNIFKSFNQKFIFRGIKNISYLSMGQIITIILNVVGFIFIARILGRHDYGVFVTVGSFIGIFSIFTFSGINIVALREGAKDLEKMGRFYEKIIGIKLVFIILSIILCLVVTIFMPYSTQEKAFIIVFSITLFTQSFSGLFSNVFQAHEKFQYNAFLSILNRIIFIPFSILILLLGFGLVGIVTVSIITQLISFILEYNFSKKFIHFKFTLRMFNDKAMIKSAIIFSLLTFTNLINIKVDVVMISWMANPGDVGIYGVASQIVNTALTARNLISVGFFPILVKVFHVKAVKWKSLMKYAFYLLAPISILSIISAFIVKDAIIIVFGQQYSYSGDILRVLIFYVAFTFFTIPFVSAMKATGNEYTIVKLSFIGPILNIVFNFIFYQYFGLLGIAISTLSISFIMFPISIFFTYKVLKKSKKIF